MKDNNKLNPSSKSEGTTVKEKIQDRAVSLIKKTSLVKLRQKAMRSGIWFKTLSRIDRVLVNLTIQVANYNIKSSSLISRLLSVTSKMEVLLESRLSRVKREIGFPLANKFSKIAQSWGNINAKTWANENQFATYLAITKINSG
jgi:hypothetical protein